MNFNEIYTVEYSVVQHCYHVDSLKRTLMNNWDAVDRNINNGYLIIGIFPNYELASAFVEQHRKRMNLSTAKVNDNGEITYD